MLSAQVFNHREGFTSLSLFSEAFRFAESCDHALIAPGFPSTPKTKLLQRNIYEDGLWDMLVFNKIAARLGGQVRFIATGSAPLGPDAIETWNTCCLFFPPLIGPFAGGDVRTRNPGTNAFGDMTFSADGTVKDECGCYKKCPGSQKCGRWKRNVRLALPLPARRAWRPVPSRRGLRVFGTCTY